MDTSWPSKPAFWHSAFTRLSLLFGGAFLLSAAVLVGLIYLALDHYVKRDTEQDIENEIARIINLVGLLEIQSYVANAADDPFTPNGGSLLYFLADPGGSCAGRGRSAAGDCPVSTLPGWSEIPHPGLGWAELDVPQAKGSSFPVLVKVVEHRTGHRLLVGKPLTQQQAFLAEFWTTALIGLSGAVVVAIVAAFLTSRWFMRRINAINARCREIARLGLDERLPLARKHDELWVLSKNVNAMLDYTSGLVSAFKRYSDQVTHDIRTPLTVLRARFQTRLAETAAGAELEHDVAYLERIMRSVETPSPVPDPSTYEHIALDEELRDLFEIYGAAAELKDIVLHLNLGAEGRSAGVWGNRADFRQMIANLLDNAVKYTPEGGDIAVSLTRREEDLVLSLADSGPGIPEEERAKVLEAGYRVEATSAVRGSGLGLGFVQGVVQRHRLHLRLEDNHPGLKLVLTIPVPQSS